MKKYFIILTLILVVSLLFIFNPMNIISIALPKISVTYNQNKIETARTDYNWFDGTNGNTCFTDYPTNLVKSLKATTVEKCSEIKFRYTNLLKKPSETKVFLVKSDNSLIEQAFNTNTFIAPKEKGEYIFLISSKWDETHDMGYVFKINVE